MSTFKVLATPDSDDLAEIWKAIDAAASQNGEIGGAVLLTKEQAQALTNWYRPQMADTRPPPAEVKRAKSNSRRDVLMALAEHCSDEGLLGLSPAEAFAIMPSVRTYPGMDELARAFMAAAESGVYIGFQVIPEYLVAWVGDIENVQARPLWDLPPHPPLFFKERKGVGAVSKIAEWLMDQIAAHAQPPHLDLSGN